MLDAYQSEAINLNELQTRRQKLAVELQQIELEVRQLAGTRGQIIHWRQVIDNADAFRRLLGDNLERLSFEERQAVAQCLIKKVVVTGEEVDIHFVLPFESSPQVINRCAKEPEGAPGHFYRLRLTDHDRAQEPGDGVALRPSPRESGAERGQFSGLRRAAGNIARQCRRPRCGRWRRPGWREKQSLNDSRLMVCGGTSVNIVKNFGELRDDLQWPVSDESASCTTFAGVALLLFVAVPARRATKIDSMTALRCE